jgi:ATP-binding cassette subfamily C protein CydCD
MLSLVDGVEQLQTFFGQYVPQLAIAALTPVAMFVIIAFWDVSVAILMLCSALVPRWQRRLVEAGDCYA